MREFNDRGYPLNADDGDHWVTDNLRVSIEKVVSDYRSGKWVISGIRDMSDYACHPTAVLSDGSFDVFVKYSGDANAQEQFETELDGLRYLSEVAGVQIPSPVGIIRLDAGTLLLMEALRAVERTESHWREIGRTLARIHRIRSERFGFHRHGFHGPLFQDNTLTDSWSKFYRERRLIPRLELAAGSGNLPTDVASRVERLIDRIDEFAGPEVTPSLVHGDAQQNNFISTDNGTFAIDPAIYYGNPEIDLAMIDSFQPVPDEFFNEYHEEAGIDMGFNERRGLWRLSIYLAAVAIEGRMHLDRLTGALDPYV